MKKHVKTYYDHFGYGEQDVIICEVCSNRRAVEIHHIEPKGMGGRHGDEEVRINSIDNLAALCRRCHEDAHNGELSRGMVIVAHKYTMRNAR